MIVADRGGVLRMKKTEAERANQMNFEVWGLLGLGGAVALFLVSPDAVDAREAMWSVVTGAIAR